MSSGATRIAARAVSGTEAARAWSRLRYGRWEPVVPIATTVHWTEAVPGRQKENPKQTRLRGREYRCEAQGQTGP